MATKIIKNSFNAGELSPYLDGRTDLAKYYNGCSVMSNAIPLPTGGFVARSGSEWIAKGKGACRLIPFEFSADDVMVIEAGNTYMRFYKDDDRVMTSSKTIIGITLPSGSEVSIEATGHGLATGNVVRFTSVGGTTELNYTGMNTEWTITKTDANNFTLDGTDGDDFTAWTSGGTVAAIYEITTPYSASEVFELSIARSGDIIRIDHEDYAPRKLTRTADNSWTIAEIDFTDGPFLNENTTTTYLIGTNTRHTGTHTGANNAASLTDSSRSWVTNMWVGFTIYNTTDGSNGVITANTATGVTATLAGGTDNDWDTNDAYYIDTYYISAGTAGFSMTASGHTPFDENMVGGKFLLLHTRTDNTTQTASEAIKIKGDFSLEAENFDAGIDSVVLWRKEGNGDWQEVRTFHGAVSYSGTEYEDSVQYKFTVTDANSSLQVTLTAKNQTHRSVVEITAFVSTSIVTVTALTDIYHEPTDTDNSTIRWAEGAWSDYRGWPRAVTFHENRVWHAGTVSNPTTAWGTRTDKYDDYTPGSLDSDAVTITLQDDDASEIVWLKSRKGLLAGTGNKEYLISASDINDPITPDDVKAVIQSSYGSKNIQPVTLNDYVFYVQRQGKRLLMARLNDYGDRFLSVDAGILSNHLFEMSPVDMAAQRTPEPAFWMTRSDGTLCVFVFNPEEEIAGWCRIVTGSTLDSPVDQYKSVTIVRGSSEDDVWVVVYRTIEGTGYYYIEKFHPRYIYQADEAMMLDSAKIVEGNYDEQNIILASDTVRYDEGVYGSSYYGGTT